MAALSQPVSGGEQRTVAPFRVAQHGQVPMAQIEQVRGWRAGRREGGVAQGLDLSLRQFHIQQQDGEELLGPGDIRQSPQGPGDRVNGQARELRNVLDCGAACLSHQTRAKPFPFAGSWNKFLCAPLGKRARPTDCRACKSVFQRTGRRSGCTEESGVFWATGGCRCGGLGRAGYPSRWRSAGVSTSAPSVNGLTSTRSTASALAAR